MSAMPHRVIELKEFVRRSFSPNEIPEQAGTLLWQKYESQVAVDFPGPKTGGQWQLTPQGWVGNIPLTESISLALQPKVPIENIFRMLEYAYGLKSFRFLTGDVSYESLQDVYERLARILARRILDRARKGLYRAYVARTETLPYVRERLDMQQVIRKPWQVRPLCHYHLHTPDIEENQILAWTLGTIIRSGLSREEVRSTVRQAIRRLQGSVALQPYAAADCVGRLYTRLNDDYRLLHALCRFFLEHTGPSLETGKHTMLPFLVDMARLFESFVAAWLGEHLHESLRFKPQERVNFSNGTYFNIDLVLYDVEADGTLGPARIVLDTKYKAPRQPATSDISQVVTYAVAKGCKEAVLIYPTPLPNPFDESVGAIRVRSLSFDLGDSLEDAGQGFLNDLLD